MEFLYTPNKDELNAVGSCSKHVQDPSQPPVCEPIECSRYNWA